MASPEEERRRCPCTEEKFQTPYRPKIVIIGAGIAGLACAKLLQNYADIKVLDRNSEEVSRAGHGFLLLPSTVEILKKYPHRLLK